MSDDADHLRDDPSLPGGPEHAPENQPTEPPLIPTEPAQSRVWRREQADPDVAMAVGDDLEPGPLDRLTSENALLRAAIGRWQAANRASSERNAFLAQRVRELEADNLDLIGRAELADRILDAEAARDTARHAAEARAASIEAERHVRLPGPDDSRHVMAWEDQLGAELRGR